MSAVVPRLALVVASQSQSMPRLKALDSVARGLHAVLVDPHLGACADALSAESPGPLLGTLHRDRVDTAVRTAVERAGAQGATLILAFLGHGFVGVGQSLYFMCRDSTEDNSRTSANVTGLLMEAADESGLDGLAAIVDVCFAGAAPPSGSDLVSGARQGQSNVDALMGATATERAYGMRFGAELAGVIRRGVDDVDGSCPTHIDAASVLDVVRPLVPGQSATMGRHDGDLYGAKPWLAWNARHPQYSAIHSPRPRRPAPAALTRDDRFGLMQLMIAIPAVRDLFRMRNIVARLPEPVPKLILADGAPGIDLLTLLRTLEERPDLDAWQRLLSLLRDSTGGEAYHVEALAAKCRSLGLTA